MSDIALAPTSGVATGSVIADTGNDELYIWTGSEWTELSGGGGGSGTVTSVSVVSANGFAGTVANATTTPAITLETTITGILQGDGTAISAATTGDLTESTSDVLTISGGTGAVLGSGTSIDVKKASGSQDGYLSSTDWTTFNGKQGAGNYITALTGDGTASGPGSSALTLATVNADTGSFGSASSVATFTANGKGLITAAASTSIQIAESQVTNLVTDLAGKQATGNYATSGSGDVSWPAPSGAGPVTTAIGSNKVANSQLAQMATLTLKGNNTGSTANAADLTVSQVNTMLGALSNPMSASGDMIYGGSSGVPTRLIGDISNARKFLNSTASSGTAQDPAWSFQRAYLNETSDYTLAIGDDSVIFNISTAKTATLPTAVSVTSQEYYIQNYLGSSASLALDTTSSQTIGDRASGSIILSPGDNIHVISDGSNWQILNLTESVSASYFASTSQSANGVINFDTENYDAHSSVTTGASWKYTAPVSGIYRCSAAVALTSAGTATDLAVYKNGSLYKYIAGWTSLDGTTYTTGSTSLRLLAGDYIDFRGDAVVSINGNSGGTLSSMSIEKVGN